jgi:hypothetical protein
MKIEKERERLKKLAEDSDGEKHRKRKNNKKQPVEK